MRDPRLHKRLLPQRVRLQQVFLAAVVLLVVVVLSHELHTVPELEETPLEEAALEYVVEDFGRLPCLLRRLFRGVVVRVVLLFRTLYYPLRLEPARVVTDFAGLPRPRPPAACPHRQVGAVRLPKGTRNHVRRKLLQAVHVQPVIAAWADIGRGFSPVPDALRTFEKWVMGV